MVDPAARVLEALKLVDGAWVELGAWTDDGGLQRIEPFDAIELDLGLLFPAWSIREDESCLTPAQ